MKYLTYEEKIERIFDNNAMRYGNWDDVDALLMKIEFWLRCEWQCGNIGFTEEYLRLSYLAREIVIRKFKEL